MSHDVLTHPNVGGERKRKGDLWARAVGRGCSRLGIVGGNLGVEAVEN